MDAAAMDSILDAGFGVPAALTVRLVTLDSAGNPVEISGPGYTPGTIDTSTWPASSGGTRSVVVSFGTPTGEWSDSIVGFTLTNPATGDDWTPGRLGYVPFTELKSVVAAGPLFTATLSVFIPPDDEA